MVYSHSLSLPWSISAEDERRFRKILTIIMALTVALAIAIPYLPIFKKSADEDIQLPPRVAKLVFEKHTAPKPKLKPRVVKKKPEPVKKKNKRVKKKQPTKVAKKVQAKKPKVEALEQARKKASSAGLLALQDSLADLRNQSVDELRGAKRLSNNASKARKTERSLITSKVGGGSHGINTSRLSRDTGSTKLAARTATQVKSSIVKASLNGRKHRTSHGASRSYEDIQIVFDRNKGTIYSLYNRALRKNPDLQGKMVIRLTITASGKITHIALVSSELGDPALEQKLLRRIKMFNFGAKQVEDVTVNYPIDFLPA